MLEASTAAESLSAPSAPPCSQVPPLYGFETADLSLVQIWGLMEKVTDAWQSQIRQTEHYQRPLYLAGGPDRYPDIWTIKGTGVRVQGADPYINANWVQFKSAEGEPLRFIAAQGPKRNTMNQFYRMLIQKNAAALVSLGPERERGREKFASPWSTQSMIASAGKLSGVKMLQFHELAEQPTKAWKERTFRVTRGEGDGFECPAIHFSNWADHGATDVDAFLHLMDRLRVLAKADLQRPVVVHCSAGIGRTGTALVFLNVIEQLAALKERESREQIIQRVVNTTLGLRSQRVFLVQKREQFEMVITAVEEWQERQFCEALLSHSQTERGQVSGSVDCRNSLSCSG